MPGNGKTTSGIWIAINLAALALLLCDQLDDGTPVWVVSEQCSYTFLASSSLTADGLAVVAPVAGRPIAGNAGAKYVRSTGSSQKYTVTTTDASGKVYASITFPPNSTAQVEAIINATQRGGPDRLALRSIFGFETNASQVAEIGLGHVNIFDRRDGAAAWDIGALVGGLTAQMAVQGENGKTIDWGITLSTTVN